MSDEFLGTIIRKAGWKKNLGHALSTAALLAAPFTGGASAYVGGAVRGMGARAAGKRALAAKTEREIAGKGASAAGKKVDALTDSVNSVKRPAPASSRTGAYYRDQRVAEDPSLMTHRGQTNLHSNFGESIEIPEAVAPPPNSSDNLAAQNYQQTLPAREGLANKRAQGFQTQLDEASAEKLSLDTMREEQGKLHEQLKVQAAEGKQAAGDMGLVGVQSQQASSSNRAAEDRQRREEDYERAREGASTGGAKSTTTGF